IARAALVLLEKREMGARAAIHGKRRARFLGIARIPYLRRPVARTAVRRRRVSAAVTGARIAWRVATVSNVVRETRRTGTLRVGNRPTDGDDTSPKFSALPARSSRAQTPRSPALFVPQLGRSDLPGRIGGPCGKGSDGGSDSYFDPQCSGRLDWPAAAHRPRN